MRHADVSLADDAAAILAGGVDPVGADDWCILTTKHLEDSVRRALSSEVIAVDTETRGLNPWEHGGKGIFSLSFAWREGDHVIGRYVPLRHKNDRNLRTDTQISRDLLHRLFYEPGPLRVGQNFRFDAMFLYADELFGKLPPAPVECTKVLAHIVDERQPKSLKALAARYLPEGEGKAALGGIPSDEMSLEEVGPYAVQDARATFLVHEALVADLKAQDEEAASTEQRHPTLSAVRLLDRDAMPILWRMEARGFSIRLPYVKSSIKKATAAMAAVEREIEKLLPKAWLKENPLEMTKAAWVAAAAIELGYRPTMFDKRKKPKTSAEAFNAAGFGEHPFVRLLWQWRAYHKLVQSYFRHFLERSAKDRYGSGYAMHAEIEQASARSGRLQARNPSMMNLPLYKVGTSRALRQKELKRGRASIADEEIAEVQIANELDVRKALKPRKGYTLVFADFSQQELRAFADISQEPEMMAALTGGDDIHAVAASAVAPRPEDPEGVVAWRGIGKLSNFGLIFGMGWKRFYSMAEYEMKMEDEWAQIIDGGKRSAFYKKYKRLPTHEDELKFVAKRRRFYEKKAQEIHAAYHRKFQGIKLFHRALQQLGFRRGYIANKYGRRRRMEGTAATWWASKWFNFIIQGSCADLLRWCLITLDRAIRERQLEAHPLMTIHDEVIFEVRNDHLDSFCKLVPELLEHPTGWSVRFPIEIGTSTKQLEK